MQTVVQSKAPPEGEGLGLDCDPALGASVDAQQRGHVARDQPVDADAVLAAELHDCHRVVAGVKIQRAFGHAPHSGWVEAERLAGKLGARADCVRGFWYGRWWHPGRR